MATQTEFSSIWEVLPTDLDAAENLQKVLGLEPIVARLLVQRGLMTPADADKFLNPTLDHLSDPELLPDFQAARNALMNAREQGHKIYIHGDYDVDGVTSAAILYRFLERTGFIVEGHVPHREREGYGIHPDTIRRAHASGANLILTCDCGSSSHDQLAAAYELGMKVVVTDHHESPEILPKAEAVVNPKRRDYSGPATEMAGAGIAFLLCLGMCEELGIEKPVFYRHFLDLAVMGTVADVMPLRDNNRVVAKFGLAALQSTQKKGVRALLRVSNLDDPTAKLTTRHIGYQLGPRINAVGRIDDADVAFRLLTTNDQTEATELATFLDRKNQERRDLQDDLIQEAFAKIVADGLDRKSAIVVAGEGWQKGIVGIVAGKVVEKFRRPSFVLGIHGDIASGSARSIPAFNLYDAIEASREHLIKGGGHAAAAGVSLQVGALLGFADAIDTYASERLTEEDFLPRIRIDQEVNLPTTSLSLAKAIASLEPFGEANPEPSFVMRGVRLATCTPTRNPIHCRVTLQDGDEQRFAMAFGLGELFAEVKLQTKLDVVCNLEEDTFNGNTRLKMVVRDFREV
ncbi:MAG: single-stranded-DNA-specific exonuclease RecJ [Fimbriimonadaceae bacterium]